MFDINMLEIFFLDNVCVFRIYVMFYDTFGHTLREIFRILHTI